MTGRIEKSVFISYRHTNVPWALAVYQNLTAHGYDIFFDFQSIDSGNFEEVILENIRTRAHFVLILTPSALERCKEPEDWLRREIETAIDQKRNIVPLMLENFDFGSPVVAQALTGKLSRLNKYNGLRIYSEYFFEAMDKLRNRYLNVPITDIILPVMNVETQEITKIEKIAASEAPSVREEELTAQTWFERGFVLAFDGKNIEEAIRCFTEAIRLKPDFVEAYNARGTARLGHDDLGAIADYYEGIRLKSDDGIARLNLVKVLQRLGRWSEANKQAELARPIMGKETEYNQACFEAIRGNTDRAFELLRIALEKNQPPRGGREWARKDPDFESIRDDPRFKELVGE